MIVRVLTSNATSRNPTLKELHRKARENNLNWLIRVVKEVPVPTGAERSIFILLGGNDPLSFRLRVGQSHVRHDLSPSAWSHVAFVSDGTADLASATVLEVSLAPEAGFAPFGYVPPTNGLQSSELRRYRSEQRFPNIAIISLPIEAEALSAKLDRLKYQRSIVDVPVLILKWLTYAWGVGVPASPLADGFGVPSAAVLETACAAVGFDLTPGLESRSTCPEAIWQAAAWWYDYKGTRTDDTRIVGAFSALHDLVPDRLYGEQS